MSSTNIESRLVDLGLTLPNPATPGANYIPTVITGNLVYTSGQLPLSNGALQYKGKLGRELSVEDGKKAAQLCALNMLAQLKVACGDDLGRVRKCIRIGGYVNCTPEFSEQAQVINGASDLLVEVMGESGKHARTAVGVAALPRGAAVEVEAIFEIE